MAPLGMGGWEEQTSVLAGIALPEGTVQAIEEGVGVVASTPSWLTTMPAGLAKRLRVPA